MIRIAMLVLILMTSRRKAALARLDLLAPDVV
eukprot:COSAG02_NODE_51656_length_312_cov_1.690141_2_plen_31_part_01